jgi:hypothetical protein
VTDAWELWLASPDAAVRFDSQAQSFEDRRRWARGLPAQRSSAWAVSRALLAHVDPGDRARSLSHAGGFAALAVGPAGSRIGVDLEHVDPRRDPLRLARFAFDAREAAQLEALRGAARTERFYVLWILKEAAIKALGLTLLKGLRHCVFLKDGDGWRVRLPLAMPAVAVQLFRPRPDLYLGALIVGQKSVRWRELEWPSGPEGAWEQLDFEVRRTEVPT